mgnify:CR=1 FL=1
MLSYTSRRETLITQLIAEALRVGVDGINVDFEKISDKCGEHYIEFIRELSVKCRQNGLVLSVDNYVPKSFNTQYDRKEQGIVADYVVIMGYDEYYAGSPEAGPVSSYNYVKEGITETLKEVPAEKVISGIPFFTHQKSYQQILHSGHSPHQTIQTFLSTICDNQSQGIFMKIEFPCL